MKTSLFGGRPLRLVTSRRRQVETLSKPLELFIAAEYLSVAISPPSGFQIAVAETLQAPAQSSTTQTIMPGVVSELTFTPEQSAVAGTSINVIVNETLLTPVQSILAETSGGKKQVPGAGGPNPWGYYPPILTIRTRGNQTAPAPGEQIYAKFNQAPKPASAIVIKKKLSFITQGRQATPAPYQTARVKSHREVKARNREESDILALLASL